MSVKMTFRMTFRWYGEKSNRIKLSDIRQIPGVWDMLEKFDKK